jgi:hypothetical protein
MMLPLRLACLLLAAVSLNSAADEIMLRNGDRISGEIAGKLGEKLLVRSPAGQLSIDWGAVASISTTHPVELMLEGARTPIFGLLQPLPDGDILLVDLQGNTTKIALKDIAYLDPKPYQAGRGPVYRGRVMLSAVYARGNASSDRLYGEGDFTARAKPYRYALGGRVDRRSVPVLGTTTGWQTTGNYDRFLDDVRFGYVRGWLEHDRAKDIDQLTVVGIGLGLQLLDTPRADFSVRGGLDYIMLDRVSGPSRQVPAFGWGVKAMYAPWGRRVEMFHEHLGFWSLQNSDAVLVRSKTGVRTPLADRLRGVAQINVNWDRRPTPGRNSTDSLLLIGIDYAW